MEEKIVKLLEIIYESYNNDVGKLAEMMAQIKPDMENVADDIMNIVKKHLSFDKLKPELIQIYTEYFNEADIDAITHFYSSETGKKFIANQPDIYVKTQLLSQKILAENQAIIDKELEEVFAREIEKERLKNAK